MSDVFIPPAPGSTFESPGARFPFPRPNYVPPSAGTRLFSPAPSEIPVSIRSAPAYRGSYLPAVLEPRPMGPAGSTGQAASRAASTASRAGRTASAGRGLLSGGRNFASQFGRASSVPWAEGAGITSRIGGLIGRGARASAPLLGGEVVGRIADMTPDNSVTRFTDPVTESTATGLSATAIPIATGASRFAGPVGIGVGAADLAARGLAALPDWGPLANVGSEEGITGMLRDVFGGGDGGGFAPDAGKPLYDTYDQLNIPHEVRRRIDTVVNQLAKEGAPGDPESGVEGIEGGYADGGAQAVNYGVQLATEWAAEQEEAARQMQRQSAVQNLMERIGGQEVARAEAAFSRAQQAASFMPPDEAQMFLASAANEIDRAQSTANAYAAQAALQPQYNQLLKTAQTDAQLMEEINRERRRAEIMAELGLGTGSELPEQTS